MKRVEKTKESNEESDDISEMSIIEKYRALAWINNKIIEYRQKRRAKKIAVNELIKKVAHELADIFEHWEIREAAEKGKFQVIGYLKDMYLDYEVLLENKKELFKLACFYSRTEREPVVYSLVPEIILNNYVKTVVELPGPVEFENFPGEKFSEIAFLAPKHLKAALHWIDDYKEPIDGYPARVKMGYCSLILLGRSRHNRFLLLVRDAPGTHYLQYNAVIKAREIDEVIKEDQRLIINRLNADKSLVEDQIDESLQMADIYKSAYIVRTKDIQAERATNLDEEFRKRLKEKGFIKKPKTFDWTAIIIIIAFIALISFILWVFFNFPFTNPGQIENPNASFSLMKLILGRLI